MRAHLLKLLKDRADSKLEYQLSRIKRQDDDANFERQLMEKERRDNIALNLGLESLEDKRKRKKQDKQLLRYLGLIKKKTSNQRKIPNAELKFMIRLLQRDIDPSEEVKDEIKNTISNIPFEQLQGNQRQVLQAIKDADQILDDVFTNERGQQKGQIPRALNELGLSPGSIGSLSTKELQALSKQLNLKISKNGENLSKKQLFDQIENIFYKRQNLGEARENATKKLQNMIKKAQKKNTETIPLEDAMNILKTPKIKRVDRKIKAIKEADRPRTDGRKEIGRLKRLIKQLNGGEDPEATTQEGLRKELERVKRTELRDVINGQDRSAILQNVREYIDEQKKEASKEERARLIEAVKSKKKKKKRTRGVLPLLPEDEEEDDDEEDDSMRRNMRRLALEAVEEQRRREGGPGPDLGKGQRAEDLEAEATRQLAQRQEEEGTAQGVGASESKEGENEGLTSEQLEQLGFTGNGSKMYKEMSKLVNWFNKEIKKRLL